MDVQREQKSQRYRSYAQLHWPGFHAQKWILMVQISGIIADDDLISHPTKIWEIK
jgi:hypothetical protein